MSRHLGFLLLVACSSSKPAVPAGSGTASGAAPVAQANLEDVIAGNAVAVTRFIPSTFLPLRFTHELRGATSPCWEELEKTFVAGYQVEIDVTPRTSYFVLEGNFPRDAVIDCIPRAIQRAQVTAKRDGELVAIAFVKDPQHPVYVGWRDRFVVFGTKPEVEAALQTPTAQTRARWQAVRTAQPTGAAVWAARTDRLVANLFGVETASYVLVIDKLEPANFAGRLVVTYHNTGDAAVAARRIKQGELQTTIDAPPALVTSFKRMVVKQDGVVVELRFTFDTFGGLTLDELTQWAQKLSGT